LDYEEKTDRGDSKAASSSWQDIEAGGDTAGGESTRTNKSSEDYEEVTDRDDSRATSSSGQDIAPAGEDAVAGAVGPVQNFKESEASARIARILEEDSHFESAFSSFPEKLMTLLDEERVKAHMWWLPDGDAFCMRPENFAEYVLDLHFQGTKFESFTRKLNRWYAWGWLFLFPARLLVLRSYLLQYLQPVVIFALSFHLAGASDECLVILYVTNMAAAALVTQTVESVSF
jgi:HSF-type DNA-binding